MQKNYIPDESGQVPNTCYKTVLRKLPTYKLKQKMAEKLKINVTNLARKDFHHSAPKTLCTLQYIIRYRQQIKTAIK